MDLVRDLPAEELERNFSHVAESYDELPYDDRPISRTHPARLAGTARLFGMNPPPIATARVLELGCAAGANIIPLAAFYPQAQFVGIDLGRLQIDDGNRRIAAIGLGNIELRCQSITELPDTAGQFDYIICHGVYSWVPEPVREAIFDVCRRFMSADGIAYISYNVLPGWRSLQPLRDALRAMVPKHLSAVDRAKLGRRLAHYLMEMTPDKSPYGATLKQLPRYIDDSSDAYLFHEYMEDVNDPCLFTDFVGAAGRHDLAYLCETELSPMFAERFGAEFAEKVEASTQGDVISYEQMLDILSGNTFRTTLLVHGAKLSGIDRRIAMERLTDLHFLASYLYTAWRDGDEIVLTSRSGQETRFDDPVIQRLIDRLFSGMLRSWSFEDAVAGFSEADLPDVIESLIAMVMGGTVIILAERLPIGSLSEYPRANPVALADMRMGRTNTATRIHAAVDVDGFGQFVLAQLDGTKSIPMLKSLVGDMLARGEMNIELPEGIDPTLDWHTIAGQIVDQTLKTLAGYGLLED